jgi:hypothetical protein
MVDGGGHEDSTGGPVLLEVDSQVAGIAMRAFEEWAGTEHVRVFFEPDTVMAVERPGRRGYLYDEVYFVTMWAGDGGDQLLASLRRDIADVLVKDISEEPNPEEILALVLRQGAPIDKVRHLI